MPMPNQLHNYGLPNSFHLIDHEKLGELDQRLNILLEQPVSKIENDSKQQSINISSDADEANWVCPSMLLVFLQNSIEANTNPLEKSTDMEPDMESNGKQ